MRSYLVIHGIAEPSQNAQPRIGNNAISWLKGKVVPIAKINGINLNFEIDGHGKPLVLISGLGADLKAWIFQRSFRKHFQVIRLDNRGVGKSDRPTGPYTIRTMADDIIGLLDHLGIDAANILGVSMGGMIAQEIAINYSQRVSKLVLGCTFACQRGNSGQTEEYAKVRSMSPAEARTRVVSLANNRPINRLIFVPLMRLIAAKGWEAGFQAQREAIRNHDTLERLHLIQSPTLVIVGTKDKVIRPSSSDVIAERIPNVRLVRIEKGSHSISAEYRKEFNKAVLRFLLEGK